MIKLMVEETNNNKVSKLDKTIKLFAKSVVRDYDYISKNKNLYDFLENNDDAYKKLEEAETLVRKAWKIISAFEEELEETYGES